MLVIGQSPALFDDGEPLGNELDGKQLELERPRELVR